MQSLNLKVLNLKTNKNNYIIYEQEESLSAEYEAPKCKAIKQHQNDNNNSNNWNRVLYKNTQLSCSKETLIKSLMDSDKINYDIDVTN